MATYEFTITGSQIATFSDLDQAPGNAGDVTLDGITVLGDDSDIYTVTVVDQANKGPQFANGQWVTITGPDGTVLFENENPQSDKYSGLATGDEHAIFEGVKDPDSPSTKLNFVIDLGGFDGSDAVYTTADEVADAGEGDNDGEFDFADACFTPGTMIRTPDGARAIETLMAGDLVSTLDSGPVPITWIKSRSVDFVKFPNKRRPVLFGTNSAEPLVVSPQHRMLRRVNGRQVLVPAAGLTHEPGVREKRGARRAEYFSLMTPMHELIWANGTLCETFYPGSYLMANLPKDFRDELYQLRPLLRFGVELGYGPAARPFLTVRGKPVGNAVRKDFGLTPIMAS